MNHKDTKNTKAETKAVAIAKPVKVPTLKTGDDADVAAEFTKLFNEAQNGLRRVMAFALFAWDVKMNRLKHGQFMAWVEHNCPDASYRSVRGHMQLAESALEAAGYKTIKGFLKKCAPFQSCKALQLSPAGQLLLAQENALPAEAVEIRNKIFPVIDGKTANQLFIEFKQAEEDEDGNVKAKVGRLKGQGGASAAQRAKAKQAEEEGRIEALELRIEEFRDWVYENCNLEGFGSVGDVARGTLSDIGEHLIGFARNFTKKEGK